MHGLPKCDTCNADVRYSEAFGWSHYVDGDIVDPMFDGHVPTADKWISNVERDWFENSGLDLDVPN